MDQIEISDDDETVITVRVIDTRNIGGRQIIRIGIENEDGMGGPNWHANISQIDALIDALERAKEEIES